MSITNRNNFAISVFENIQNPKKIFCVDSNGGSITYGEIETKTRKFSHYFDKNHQIGPGTRVAILMDDCVEWPITFLALILIGANPILLFSNMIDKDKYDVLARSETDWIVSDSVKTGTKIIHIKDLLTSDELYDGAHNWNDIKTCWWTLSSGSGGRYKIIVHNHASFKKLYDLANQQVGVKSHDVVLCTAKMAFAYGLAQLYWVLKNNATLCLISKTPAPTLIFNLIKEYKITRLNVGPYLLNAMCENKKRFNLDKVKIVCSGEYLSQDLRFKVSQQLGCRVYDTYGATEVWTTISFQNDPDTNDMGTILEGIKHKIVDGELYIKHPLQAMMYWKDTEATKKTFKQNWLATGDAVKVIDNRLIFLGRIDNMIKIKGTFVSILDLEDAINSSHDVAECVVGVRRSGTVPEVGALVKFVKDGNVPSLRKYLRTILPSDKIPKYIEQVDELPKTVNNKLKRNVTAQIDYSG